MSDKDEQNKSELIPSRNRNLAIKRSDLVKRGFQLISEVEKLQAEALTDLEKKKMEDIISLCEAYYIIEGLRVFSSMTDFCKFLLVDIPFNAKWNKYGRLDIEKAKEAYISWAKERHAAEYDKLFMEFFNELVDGKKTFSRQEMMARLEGVDFQVAAETIAFMLREAGKKQEPGGVQYIMKKELRDATDHYTEQPCLESAITLLETYPSWLELFELTKDPLHYPWSKGAFSRI